MLRCFSRGWVVGMVAVLLGGWCAGASEAKPAWLWQVKEEPGAAQGETGSGPALTEGFHKQGKAVVFDASAKKLVLPCGVDRTQPMTALVIVRPDFDPSRAGSQRHWVLDAGSNMAMYSVWQMLWSGPDLVLQAGKSVNPEKGDGLVVTFSAAETGAVKGRWLLVALSVKNGEAVGCVGALEGGEPRLKNGQVLGKGSLPQRAEETLALGNRLSGGTANDTNQVAIQAAAIYPRALSPEEIAGIFQTVRAGGSLDDAIVPAKTAKLAADPAQLPADAHQAQNAKIDTAKMTLEFQDGWLTRWVNKETGETVDFGKHELARTGSDRHYAPGPWWPSWRAPARWDATGTDWSTQVEKIDETSAALVQSASRRGGEEVAAVQWSLRVPYDQVDAVHFPKGMPPARMSGKGTLDLFLAKNHEFDGRLGEDSGSGAWRLRFYQVQGKTGGLLIYMDDPELNHYANLEFRQGEGELTITNRSFASPPWKDQYQGGRWVIRQYTGYTNAGAQLFQDYLKQAYQVRPLAERATGWVKKLGFVFVQAAWTEPLPLPGHRRPHYNYSSNWEDSIRASEQWLENLAKVLPPQRVMIYTSQWRTIPNIDRGLQDNALDPFFVIMCQKARKMGFHVQLHFNQINLTTDSVCYERYFAYQSKLKGMNELEGVIRNAYTGRFLGGGEPTQFGGWPARAGYNRPAAEFHMNSAFEGWRYFYVGSILSAVKATGADAVHLDVPIALPDMDSQRYGMNSQQGLREFGRLLRKTLDENDLQHVAIGTEVTPPESLLAVTDYAQATRGKSVVSFVDGLVQGKYREADQAMIMVQQGEDLAKTKAERERLEKERARHFDASAIRPVIGVMRELGEASINSMVVGPFVQSGPHLGTVGPIIAGKDHQDAKAYDRFVNSMILWYAMTHDTMVHGYGARNMFMDCPPYDQLETIQQYRKEDYSQSPARKHGRFLSEFDYHRLALARFWSDQTPQLLPPGQWEKGDIGRYGLADGKTLRVTRSGPSTLRWAYADGAVLAELDLFDGWKNDGALMQKCEPTFLKNQIDEFVE